MPALCARAAPSNAKRIPSMTPAYMARPPRSGMGWRWTLRGPGRSTIPTRKASARTGTTSMREANKAIKKAVRPAAMRPRYVSAMVPAGVVRPEPHVSWPGWGPSSQDTAKIVAAKRSPGCPTQQKHHTAVFVAVQSRKYCSYPYINSGRAEWLPLGEQACKDALDFFAVAGGEVPVDGAP